MSLRGVRQCKKILIQYSDYDGSSRGIRSWMSSRLVDFAKTNPLLEVETQIKRNRHPFLRGYYANGNIKTIGIKNQDEDNIESFVFDLRAQIGRKTSSSGYFKPVLSGTPSIQGEWTEDLVVNDFDLEIQHVYHDSNSNSNSEAN